MNRYRDQVAAALAAVRIRGATHFAWLGRASRPLAASVEAEIDESARRGYLLACLRDELYASFYCHGGPVSSRRGEPEPVSADPWLAAALSGANTGRGTWEPGWRVTHVEWPEVVVATARLRARVAATDCRALAGPVRPGAAVSVRLPKELPAFSPGFYTVVGDASGGTLTSGDTVRAYWNVGRAGAPALVHALTSRLNNAGAPFRLKVADHPFRFERCDAAVLYLPAEAFRELVGTLRQVAAGLTTRLRPAIPAFTLELVPGVGLAEEYGAEESFGARRCTLLAEGILRAHERALQQTAAQVDAVAATFAEHRVRIDAPYLEPSLAGRHVL
jgi:hypothetical protein